MSTDRASGSMSTTATADLEVLLHVESIRFELDKVQMKEYARVMSKQPGYHLCILFEELQKDEVFIDHGNDHSFTSTEDGPQRH